MEDLVYYPISVVAALVGQNLTVQNVNLYVHTQINCIMCDSQP